MGKRLLLIQPADAYLNLPFNHPPLGLAYLGAVAEKEGWQVKTIVASAPSGELSPQQIIKQACAFGPELIGINIPTFSAKISYNLIKELKACGAFIVAGGAHSTALPEEVLTQSPCDAVARGEAEKIFPLLLAHYRKKDSLNRIPGLTFQDSQGRFIHNPQPPLCSPKELDQLDLPAKHLFRGQFPDRSLGNIAASRGCPYSCIFCSCSVFGRSYRQRSAENVLGEIKHLRDKYSLNYLSFVDDVFTLDPEWVREFCAKLAAEKSRIYWSCSTRVDRIDASLLKAMKEAGCICIKYGIESLNPGSLEKIKKNVIREQIDHAVELTRAQGIAMWLNFMLGFPWDTAEDIKQQFEFIRKISPWAMGINNGSLVIAFPATGLYDMYKEKYGEKKWWLDVRLGSGKLRLYQRLVSYNPAIEKTGFPLPKQVLRILRRKHFLFNAWQVINHSLIEPGRRKTFQKLLERLETIAVRLVRIFFICLSILLSRVCPKADTEFLVPFYLGLSRGWGRLRQKLAGLKF